MTKSQVTSNQVSLLASKLSSVVCVESLLAKVNQQESILMIEFTVESCGGGGGEVPLRKSYQTVCLFHCLKAPKEPGT